MNSIIDSLKRFSFFKLAVIYLRYFYRNFLGRSQFIAGSLLITQRFATVGAMLLLPIILNVFMITHSIDFGTGTPGITTLLLLGTMFLLVWDYKKWIILFRKDHQIKLDLTQKPEDTFMTHPIWIIVGVIFIALTFAGWLLPIKNIMVLGICLIGTGIVPLVFMLIRHRHVNAKV